MRITVFLLLSMFALTPWCGPATALVAGSLFSLIFGNPWLEHFSVWSKRLLQWSVVGIGFGVNISDVWLAGRDALLYTPASIALTLGLGLLLGRLFGTELKISILVSFGTAICGGSAIAAMAPAIKAESEDMAVSLATVFSLNAAALLIFPPLGHLFGLTEHRFGLWAALAIHDTSSVVGAASAYGAAALTVGTTVKLARAIWIVPSVLLAAHFTRTHAKAHVPLFIVGFVLAATARSLWPGLSDIWQMLNITARQGLVITLLLVGSGLTRSVLQRVGARPFVQGFALWCVVSVTILLTVLSGVIN